MACVTTDFAMQNVLLQMGLRLVSADGMRVRRVKQWQLLCGACGTVTSDMDKMFCPKCGNAGLRRVSVSVDRMGRTKLHTRPARMQKHNLQGTKYSIPNKVGGRFDGGMLLREDQMQMGLWNQKLKQKQKAIESFGGLDVLDKVGLTVNQRSDVAFGFGRKNPNSRKGRERRGKKKSATQKQGAGNWW